MSVNFSLMSQDGPVLSLDDEPIFHRLLSRLLSARKVSCFTDRRAFQAEVQRQIALQQLACDILGDLIDAWRTDSVSLIQGVLDYWRSPNYVDMATVAIIDYRMPFETGLEVLANPILQAWKGRALLLTAHADERVAVDAFNAGLIEQFVSKQAIAERPESIETRVRELQMAGNQDIELVWSSQMCHPTRAEVVTNASSLRELYRQRGWTRHAVIGDPFGILALTDRGDIEWFQLETKASLATLAELWTMTGLGAEQGESISRGEVIAAANHVPGVTPFALEPAQRVGSLYGAPYQIDLT